MDEQTEALLDQLALPAVMALNEAHKTLGRGEPWPSDRWWRLYAQLADASTTRTLVLTAAFLLNASRDLDDEPKRTGVVEQLIGEIWLAARSLLNHAEAGSGN